MNERLNTLMKEYERCKRAFFQAPTPALGAALRRIERAIAYQKRTGGK